MDVQMAYLLGMILGNGEIQRGHTETIVSIDIPHKKLETDDLKDASVYVLASTVDIRNIIEPCLETSVAVNSHKRSVTLSFKKANDSYVMKEIVRFIGGGLHHATMKMNKELFDLSLDEKKALLRGIADVTGYVRKSNYAFGNKDEIRVYIEVPKNWDLVIDIANMLKAVDVPIQTIDFGHPNFRDSNLEKYKDGKPNYWKKEHQIKIYANEFIPIGFNVKHKQDALVKYSKRVLLVKKPEDTHKYYWEKPVRKKAKPFHPRVIDPSLPSLIRGKQFSSWTEIASILGYGE